jgi:hypothetical protein
MLLSLLLACDEPEPEAPAPYGMILKDDGQLYAGAARVEITPTITETYTDENGNNEFDGCNTDPSGTRGGCDEPYHDANGNGHFDGVWMAGFQSRRAAQDVHDPLAVTAVVMSLDGEYVAFVGVDAIGLLENRVRDAADVLAGDGFDRDRLIVSSSHVHSAADTVGIWGLDETTSGADPEYTASITAAILDTVQSAASVMEPVSPTVGQADLDGPEFNGEPFGGINPDPTVEAGINDIRDPLISAGSVLSIALDGKAGRVATIVNASGHPETSGDDHSSLSADYPGVMRDWFDTSYGGTTVFLSGALGGMQSALGSTAPMVDEAGERILEEDGSPVWLRESSFEFVRVWGSLLAQEADASLTDKQPWSRIRVRKASYLVPVDNVSFALAFQLKLLDTPDEYIDMSPDCPGYGSDPDVFGCVPAASWVIELGPVTFGSAPGELFPELFWGVPDEPAMVDAALRGQDRRWVQVDHDCDGVDFATQCKDTAEVAVGSDCDGEGAACDGTCNCLRAHAAPYRVSDELPTPIIDLLPGTYKAPLGITNAYCGYIVPGPDFNTWVNVTTEQGDHYEETNSCTGSFGDLVLGAFTELAAQ